MYLTAEKHLCSYDDDEKLKVKKVNKIFNMKDVKSLTIKFEIGYWRKANHMHNWFVNNCQETFITKEELIAFLKVLNSALDDKKNTKDILPTESGFFFGGTEYDKHYFNEIKRTIKIIEKAIKLYNEDYYIYYQTSW